MMTSNQKGKLAESKALSRAVELGYVVSIPYIDCRYDMILDDGKDLIKVQVKYADGKSSCSQGSVIVNLTYETRQRRKVYTYSKYEVDALVVYIPSIDQLCWFPNEVFANKKALCVRIGETLNGQLKYTNLAKDYLW